MSSSKASDQAISNTLEIICKPCSGGTCPTVYRDSNGRIFLQGNKLADEEKQGVAVAANEDIVEIDSSLIEFLRTL